MRLYWTFILTFMLGRAVAQPLQPSGLIPNWEVLDGQLFTNPVFASWEQLSNESPIFGSVLKGHKIRVLEEMTANPHMLRLRLAGFYGLSVLAPTQALDCGLRMSLSEPLTNLAVTLIYQPLGTLLSNHWDDSTITKAFRVPPIQEENAVLLIKSIPFRNLQSWFESQDRGWVLPVYEALVLSRIYTQYDRDKQPPTQRMKSTLVEFKFIPGTPRIVFLSFADDSDPDFSQLMRLALQDASMTDFSILGIVGLRKDYILHNMDLDHLAISEDRRRLISNSTRQP